MKVNICDIDIVEGTTHTIRINCFNQDKQDFNLEGYKVAFVLTGKNDVYKKAVIDGSTINVKIDPQDTIDRKVIPYECRLFNSVNDVFHCVMGTIRIKKANKAVTEYVEVV